MQWFFMPDPVRPIPHKTKYRKMKYKLAAAAFIHDGKTLSQCAEEFDIVLQNVCLASKQDDWVGFQSAILSGEIGGVAKSSFLEKVQAFGDTDLIEHEISESLRSAKLLQDKRAQFIDMLEEVELDAVPALLTAISALRKEIEEILLIKEARRAISALFKAPKSTRDVTGECVDLSTE